MDVGKSRVECKMDVVKGIGCVEQEGLVIRKYSIGDVGTRNRYSVKITSKLCNRVSVKNM